LPAGRKSDRQYAIALGEKVKSYFFDRIYRMNRMFGPARMAGTKNQFATNASPSFVPFDRLSPVYAEGVLPILLQNSRLGW